MKVEHRILAALLAVSVATAAMFRPPWYIRLWFRVRSVFSRDHDAERTRLERWLDEHRTDDRSSGR